MVDKSKYIVGLLELIGPDFWRAFRDHSKKSSARLLYKEWWHNKLYKNNPPNSGDKEQVVFGRSHVEIPWYRELFYPSPKGRFSLGQKPVAYFSEDFATNCCEVIEQFREVEALHFSELERYFRAQNPVSCEWYGSPQSIKIEPTALVADLSSSDSPLFGELIRLGDLGTTRQFFEQVVLSWDVASKKTTQELSKKLEAEGFSGVVYKSVRVPVDVVLPAKNLVLFRKEVVVREPFDPGNPRGVFAQRVGSEGKQSN